MRDIFRTALRVLYRPATVHQSMRYYRPPFLLFSYMPLFVILTWFLSALTLRDTNTLVLYLNTPIDAYLTLDIRCSFTYTECNVTNKTFHWGVVLMSNAVQPLKDRRDIERIKKALNGRNLLLFTIGINTSLRISDILPLRVQDVSGDYIYVKEQKTDKTKHIRVNDAIKEALKELVPKDAKASDYLFPSRKGEAPISRVQAWRILNAAAKRAGLNHIRFGTHSMRKSFAYHAYKSGVELPLLMRVLNHSSEKETLRYIGIESEQIDEVYIDVCL